MDRLERTRFERKGIRRSYPGAKISSGTQQILAMIPFDLLKSTLSEGIFGLSRKETDDVLDWYRQRILVMGAEGVFEELTDLLMAYLEETQGIQF